MEKGGFVVEGWAEFWTGVVVGVASERAEIWLHSHYALRVIFHLLLLSLKPHTNH